MREVEYYEDDSCPADQITIEVSNLEDESSDDDKQLVHDTTTCRAAANNVSVVRKPKLVKFKSSKGFREIVKIKQKKQPLKKSSGRCMSVGAASEPRVTAIKRVVTDTPEGNKRSRPGPFHAASRVLSASTAAAQSSSRWMERVGGTQALRHGNGEVGAPQQANGVVSREQYTCRYCTALSTTQLEQDLHVMAQHKHEIASQERVLQCLEEGCAVSCSNVFALKQHLVLAHTINFPSKFFTFQHMDEFSSWKQDLEAISGTRFLFFSSFSEVTGGTTRLYVCNNEGQYDHKCARQGKRRRVPDGAITSSRVERKRRKTGRACTAQLLVRSWGWGAIEVDATLLHYGHTHAGVQHGIEHTVARRKKPASLNSYAEAAGAVPLSPSPVLPSPREDGVRIIEGSIIGDRGMDNLQADLRAWSLVNNVSLCVCKRRGEHDTQGLAEMDDFVLGFCTSDQLDVWARHGHRAVALDKSQVWLSDVGVESSMTLCTVLVLNNRGDPVPVGWLITTRYSELLLKTFFTRMRAAYESFHSESVVQSKILLAESDAGLYKAWLQVFHDTPTLLLAAWPIHKNWMMLLHTITDISKREVALEEVSSAVRALDGTEDSMSSLLALLEHFSSDLDMSSFVAGMREQWLPQLHSAAVMHDNITNNKDNIYNGRIYFDVLHNLHTFLYVEQNFTVDYNEFVCKINRVTEKIIEETKVCSSVDGDAVNLLPGDSIFYAATVPSSMTNQQTNTASAGNNSSISSNNNEQYVDESNSASNNNDMNNSSGDTSSKKLARCMIETRHREASMLGLESVTALSQHSWRVWCHGLQDVWHTVKRQQHCNHSSMGSFKSMCSTACHQVCWLCEVCVHQYSCSCPDSVMLSTICVHIHIIRIFMLNPKHVPQSSAVLYTPPNAPRTQADLATSSRSNSDATYTTFHPEQSHPLQLASQSKEKIKLSMQNKCYSLLNILRSPHSSKQKFSRECLLVCDEKLGDLITMLQKKSLTSIVKHFSNYSVSNNTVDQNQICLSDSGSGVLMRNVSEGSSMAASESNVYYSSGERTLCLNGVDSSNKMDETTRVLNVEYECNLEEELNSCEGLLVLQEDNGRYRLVSSKSDLLEKRHSKQEVIYLPSDDDGMDMQQSDPVLQHSDTTIIVHETVQGDERSLTVLQQVPPAAADDVTELR